MQRDLLSLLQDPEFIRSAFVVTAAVVAGGGILYTTIREMVTKLPMKSDSQPRDPIILSAIEFQERMREEQIRESAKEELLATGFLVHDPKPPFHRQAKILTEGDVELIILNIRGDRTLARNAVIDLYKSALPIAA